jgi:hypothetical protein
MTVGQLIEALQEVDENLLVVMGDINGASPLSDFEEGFYVADSTWSGDFLSADFYEEEGERTDGVAAICLYDTH